MDKKYSIPLERIYKYILIAYFIYAPIYIIFGAIWDIYALPFKYRLVWLVAIIIGTIMHELTHCLIAGHFPVKSTDIRNIFRLKYLIAYCHTHKPITVRQFKFVTIIPFLLFGIVPIIIGLITGIKYILDIGIFFAIWLTGDLIVFFWLCKEKNKNIIKEDDNLDSKKISIIVSSDK